LKSNSEVLPVIESLSVQVKLTKLQLKSDFQHKKERYDHT